MFEKKPGSFFFLSITDQVLMWCLQYAKGGNTKDIINRLFCVMSEEPLQHI